MHLYKYSCKIYWLSKVFYLCLLWSLQEPKPTASSKMMMSWLKSSTPTKRKEPDESEKEESSKTQRKSAGALQQWLQEANKKPKTSM